MNHALPHLMGMKEIPNLTVAVAQIFQEARAESGVSQRELASRMGCSKSFIGAIEMKQHQPSLNTFLLMAEVLDLSPDDLIKRLRAKLLLLNSSVQPRTGMKNRIS